MARNLPKPSRTPAPATSKPIPGGKRPERPRGLDPNAKEPIPLPLQPAPNANVAPQANTSGEMANVPMPTSFEKGRQKEQQYRDDSSKQPNHLSQPLEPQAPK